MIKNAYFAAGCFWGVEKKFKNIKHVVETKVGYMGGNTENPTYKEVCKDTTNHAETVKVSYDDSNLSFEALIKEFFKLHDPTLLNRQGADFGKQYRSAIFTSTDEETEIAKKVKDEVQNDFQNPIVTEIKKVTKFWEAEEYHQNYLEKQYKN